MSLADPIADMLTRLRNAIMARQGEVAMPSSKLKVAICRVLKEEGYILDYGAEADDRQGVLRVKLKYQGNRSVIEGIAQHHERMNGSGYPHGLKAGQIGIFGRMAGIGDCFAALTKSRPYAEAVSSYEALRSITGWGGEYFHAPLTEQFVQAIGVFPVGSLVELSTGEVAVVVSHNKVRRLKPRVLLLTSPDKTPSAYPIMVDLLYEIGRAHV